MISKGLSASSVYHNLMLEKIFGNMHERFTDALQDGRVTNVRDYNSIGAWLDEDMSECMTRKKNGMKMIFRGMRRSLNKPDEKMMMNEFKNTIEFSWFRKIFTNDAKGDMVIASENIPLAFALLLEKSSATRRLAEQMIQDSLEEQQ